MKIKNIYLGYWYQRTTLHMSEAYDFLSGKGSPLNLNQHKLQNMYKDLDIKSVEMKIGHFEYIEVTTNKDINVKMDEDGLVVFSIKHSGDTKKDMDMLQEYFSEKFSPTMKYLFSLGAPLPKELANIKTISPYFIEVDKATDKQVDDFFESMKLKQYYEIASDGVNIYRAGNIFLLDPEAKFKNIEELIDMQIFFREFKVQLHRYLNMHRIIWEKIAEVKEKGEIKGEKVGDLRNQLEAYKKSIELIDGRIQQMGVHITSRENLIKTLGWEEFLTSVLQFKYHTLADTLKYINALWKMTQNYVNSAIQVFTEIQASSTKDSVKALTLITTIGVAAGVMRFLTVEDIPNITRNGWIYFGMVVVFTYVANKIVQKYYQYKKYKIKNIKIEKV